jgi:hypothetical protein
VTELERALLDYNEERWASRSEDPHVRTPREVLEQLGTDVESVSERLAGAYCFHGTRVLDPQVFFQRGVAPRAEMLTEIWATLRELNSEISRPGLGCVSDEGGNGRRGRGRATLSVQVQQQARLRAGRMLLREIFFDPGAVSAVDYLDCPETIQDIARCYQSAAGIDHERRFCDASVPCIVKFRRTQDLSRAVLTALWYAFSKLRYRTLPSNTSGYTGEGHAVPAEDIVDVEIVTSSRRRY